nr:hypothetical protein CJLB15_00017 [Campylobacter phage CJLB-15]
MRPTSTKLDQPIDSVIYLNILNSVVFELY